jgi:hypothetical protein
MPAKFVFVAQDLKRGLAVAKIVKPSSGDYVVKFDTNGATLYSADKRRMSLVNVPASQTLGVDDGWVSDEYCIPLVKMSLFDSNLDTITFAFTENAMTIKATDGKQTRRATIKKRADSTRRNMMPAIRVGKPSLVEAGKFGKLLRLVGCSALVRETKTEEEMRINQVHFRSNMASSNARYHASVSMLEGMDLDLSIIGSDIPAIRSFCSKLDDVVGLFQDKHKLYIIDTKTMSMLVLGKVVATKSDFSLPSDNFNTEISLMKDQFLDGLNWALTALDGTQRLTCEVLEGTLVMSNNGEVFSMPASFKRGTSFRVDLPAKFLHAAVSHTDSDEVLIKLGHTDNPTIVEVSDTDSSVKHYLQIMRSK